MRGWLKDMEMTDVAERVRETNVKGEQLLTLSSDEILDMLQIGEYSVMVYLTFRGPCIVSIF